MPYFRVEIEVRAGRLRQLPGGGLPDALVVMKFSEEPAARPSSVSRDQPPLIVFDESFICFALSKPRIAVIRGDLTLFTAT